jgi:hypothetical protein
MFQFREENMAKVERLLEMHEKYLAKVKAADKQIKQHKIELQKQVHILSSIERFSYLFVLLYFVGNSLTVFLTSDGRVTKLMKMTKKSSTCNVSMQVSSLFNSLITSLQSFVMLIPRSFLSYQFSHSFEKIKNNQILVLTKCCCCCCCCCLSLDQGECPTFTETTKQFIQ